MASAPNEKKAEKSTWASAVDSFNPWASSRSATPNPKDPIVPPPPPPPSKLESASRAADHSIDLIYGLSAKKYPADCPTLKVQWFHAVDAPKRKPQLVKGKKKTEESKPAAPPKKWALFSPNDSRSIEHAYQNLLEDRERKRNERSSARRDSDTSDDEASTKVAVNEDFLFDVDIKKRELAPVYWLGPIYDVRRGSWFYQEGSNLRPCEENLAAQLEEGFLKCRPWIYTASRLRSDSNKSKGDVTPKASVENLKAQAAAQAQSATKPAGPPAPPQTHRLFGAWMNSVVTYQDSNTAWLNSDGVLSWVTSTVYERFAGGGYMSGIKVVRGYSEPGKNKGAKDSKEEKDGSSPADDKSRKRASTVPVATAEATESSAATDQAPVVFESQDESLKRQLSSMIDDHGVDEEEEAVRRREEKEIQDDYNSPAGETQGREIEHLVLVTHGIGQLLGLRMESVNFVHDVNTLRKTIKSVYSTSEDLRALNTELGGGPGNSRVQVLPVCWRHLLDFPKRREEKRSELDIGLATEDEDEYPSLDDLVIEGAGFARSLISDLALDVLLYQSAYREQISEIVFREANNIYKLFMERNPGFNGKIHLLGHSLGSAIFFDILCRQKEKEKESDVPRNPLRIWPAEASRTEAKDPRDLTFDFEVEDFYCLGSPIGLFQMLKGRTVSARHLTDGRPADSPFDPDFMDDPFLQAPLSFDNHRLSPITGLPFTVSSPKAAQMFNVFYPSDPIAYRIEPLITPAMSTLKPQILPYTKKGIFSVAPQGISGIGAKVGQSMSGLWSSFSAGLASNLLNRSLGLTSEDVAKINASQQQQNQLHAASPGAGTNVSAGVVSHSNSATSLAQKAAERKKQLAEESSLNAADGGIGRKSVSGNDFTLLDDDLETLYGRFQKGRLDAATKEAKDKDAAGKVDDAEAREKWALEEAKAARLRKEETKVRALNRNGRVDYSIQEGVLDFNPLSTIASHLQYWGDEDVAHFVLSQLLARKNRQ